MSFVLTSAFAYYTQLLFVLHPLADDYTKFAFYTTGSFYTNFVHILLGDIPQNFDIVQIVKYALQKTIFGV